MFSVVFTESLIRTAGKKGTALNIRKEMKRVLYDKSDSDIRYDCICPASKVSIVRKEVLRLINHENISNCIREIGKEAVRMSANNLSAVIQLLNPDNTI